jgi:hypothetical protein
MFDSRVVAVNGRHPASVRIRTGGAVLFENEGNDE